MKPLSHCCEKKVGCGGYGCARDFLHAQFVNAFNSARPFWTRDLHEFFQFFLHMCEAVSRLPEIDTRRHRTGNWLTWGCNRNRGEQQRFKAVNNRATRFSRCLTARQETSLIYQRAIMVPQYEARILSLAQTQALPRATTAKKRLVAMKPRTAFPSDRGPKPSTSGTWVFSSSSLPRYLPQL